MRNIADKHNRVISTALLNVLLHLHMRPINQVVFLDSQGKSYLRNRLALRCFQRLSVPCLATRRYSWRYNRNTRGMSYLGPLVLKNEPLKFPTLAADRGPNCLTTFWTQLAYHFNWRTAKPLGPSPAPGCDEPTSRCQTPPSLWTLGRNQPVIPRVPFIL